MVEGSHHLQEACKKNLHKLLYRFNMRKNGDQPVRATYTALTITTSSSTSTTQHAEILTTAIGHPQNATHTEGTLSAQDYACFSKRTSQPH